MRRLERDASGRAAQFVGDRGGWAMALGGADVAGAAAEADVIIGSSGGDRQISPERLAELRAGTDRPLTVVDLALSRDFDPAVAELDGVDLITLESVRLAAPPGRPWPGSTAAWPRSPGGS